MYKLLCYIIKAFMSLIFRVEINGSENVPADGAFILCSNHLSCWDPPLLQGFVKRRIYFMAKDELFHIFGLGFILKLIKAIPVKRSGSDIAAIKTAIKVLKDDEVLGIFPTGQREMVKGEGEVKGGVALLAIKTDSPVLPIHISASYKIFSRITVNIGKPCIYSLPEGQRKASTEDIDLISKQIYGSIRELGKE